MSDIWNAQGCIADAALAVAQIIGAETINYSGCCDWVAYPLVSGATCGCGRFRATVV